MENACTVAYSVASAATVGTAHRLCHNNWVMQCRTTMKNGSTYTCDAVGGHSGAPITVNTSGYIGILTVGVHGYNTFHYCTCRGHNSSTPQVSNSRVTLVTMSASCRQCLLWGGVSNLSSLSFPLLIVVLSGIQHPTCTQSLDPVSYFLLPKLCCATTGHYISHDGQRSNMVRVDEDHSEISLGWGPPTQPHYIKPTGEISMLFVYSAHAN